MNSFNLKTLSGQIVNAAQQIAGRVKELDAEIANLNGVRRDLEALTMPRADYLNLIRQAIRKAGEVHQDLLKSDFRKVDCTVHAAQRHDLPVDVFTLGRSLRPEPVSQLALCYFFEDQIVEGVARVLNDREWPVEGALSLLEIQQEIAKTQQAIDALYTERQELIAALKSYRITE